ncbi:hypothetical protein TSAR_015024 [Trichomalopsis sarcophagae]|uniref:Elongator complex protein 1 n=1 Tax=Trichomalopsis sarcophagae TaxID=543379 RepID=A0A232FE73_9HYME|nr:hypothetical protein TSAR_015024 [Trichomalopsis sarcophagae]
MRNLVIESQWTNTFNDGDFLPHEKYHCCYNADKDRYYIIEGEDNRFLAIDASNNRKYIDEEVIFNNKELKPIGIEYCSINQEVYVACDCGLVICMTYLDDEKVKYEEIADFTNGLQCMKISPDHEVVVLITKDNVVITLSSNFDILQEVNLTSKEFGEKQFITVGWGKKETQFHGSEGKAAAKAKSAVIGKTDTDNGLPRITWKGDGTLFAVSYIDEEANARRFKVFDREGILQYTSELVDCLEGTLSWKPSGNLIASTRKLPNKHTVALFEKNGLLHREFTLPLETKNVQIEDLVWSRDSDILAVWYKDIASGIMTVQLWGEKNYHWYLKQTITYPKNNPVLYLAWSPQVNKDLLILSSKNSTIYTFYWTVTHSHGKDLADKAVVSVIDGNKVLVTGFRDGIVPPPMAQQTIQFDEPVNAISFAPKQIQDSEISSNDFLVLLSNNKIEFCQNINESWAVQYAKKKLYNVDLRLKDAKKYSFHLLQHLFWYKPNIVLCSVSLGVKSSLCEIHLLDVEGVEEITVDAKIIQEMPGQIEHIVPSSDSKTVYIVVNNKIYSYNDRDGLSKSDLVIMNESSTRAMVKVEFVMFGEKEAIVTLSRKYVLYVNGKQVSNNITSFFVHSEFLLLTTLQHALICFKLDENGLDQLCTRDLTIQPWENEANVVHRKQELSIRRLERGSTLVMAIPKDARAILQMPRGNLECIQPRALSLAIIGNFIDKLDYHKAFDLMRKQRIDLNLLYDHNPQSFIEHAEKFVQDVKNANWLSLFLTDLKDEDVTRTTYASSYENRSKQPEESVSGKVEAVCEVLRKIMEQNSNDFVQPILISLVKNQKKVGLENALKKIKQLKAQENVNQQGFSAEEALKYLLYMVDVNVLYDIALGMYDFELVMLVAQKSQKDPKEYISYLNTLNGLEENYRKFSIDSYLKRYNSALTHIAKIPDRFDECMYFIQCHELYSQGLKLYNSKSSEFKQITVAYGKHLSSKAKYREAGIMFTKGKDYVEALNAFKQANSWQDAIVTAMKLNLSFPQLTELYEELVSRLLEDKRYEAAAVILSKHLNRYEDAVATLCEGRHWHQAWTDAHCMKREDLIETHVKPGILDHAEFMLSQIRQHKQDFEKYKNRLGVVRAQAAARELAMRNLFDVDDEPTGNERGDFSDLISDTTSIAGSTMSRSSQASRSTGRSYRSSKNRRKHERKLQSIKEGSVYEDLALIRTLHQLVSQAYKQRDEVRSIAEMLLFINSDQLAAELYKVMSEFLEDIYQGKREIWPPAEIKSPDSEEPSSSSTNLPSPSTIPQNLIEPRLLNPPEEQPSDWKLDAFKVSSK